MKVKTSDLIGPALDWAVETAEGRPWPDNASKFLGEQYRRPSTDWAFGGPIIEREGVHLFVNRVVGTSESGAEVDERDGWTAYRTGRYWQTQPTYFGPTPLIAAMRCYVAMKLGDVAEVPDELLEK